MLMLLLILAPCRLHSVSVEIDVAVDPRLSDIVVGVVVDPRPL